jgi:hypothetical protein
MPHPRKTLLATAITLLASAVHAQSVSPEMQAQMMQGGAMEMVACMQKIGPEAMERMQAEGEALGAKIDQLCAAGDEAGAREAAMEMGRKMADSPTMKALQQCGENVAAMFRQQMPAAIDEASDKFCD